MNVAGRPEIAKSTGAHRIRAAAVWAVLLMLGGCGGCGPSASSSASVESGRRLLQIGRPQEAFNALARDNSPEGHYLKAVALSRLKDRPAAQAEIQKALAIEALNSKYICFDRWLLMSDAKTPAETARKAAREIVDEFQVNRSSGVIALLAVSAYLHLNQIDAMAEAFDTALTLSAESPEFMFDMLQHAVSTRHSEAAGRLVEQLIDVAPDDQQFLASLLEQSLRAKLAPQSEAVLSRLEKLSPDDPEIARRKVQVLLLAKKTDEAVAVARALHEGPDGNETTAMVFAQALADSAGTPERDQWMARLQAEYPGNLEILAKFAIYLSRSKRTADAVAMLNLAFDKATSKKAKDSIAHLAIAVPMAVEEADLAEAQLIRHAGSLPTSLWTLSFEGRIALMRKNLDEAEKKFKQVVNSPDARKPENLPVTRQSFVWLQRVRGQKLKAESGTTVAEPPEKPAPAGTKPTDDEGLLVPESSS